MSQNPLHESVNDEISPLRMRMADLPQRSNFASFFCKTKRPPKEPKADPEEQSVDSVEPVKYKTDPSEEKPEPLAFKTEPVVPLEYKSEPVEFKTEPAEFVVFKADPFVTESMESKPENVISDTQITGIVPTEVPSSFSYRSEIDVILISDSEPLPDSDIEELPYIPRRRSKRCKSSASEVIECISISSDDAVPIKDLRRSKRITTSASAPLSDYSNMKKMDFTKPVAKVTGSVSEKKVILLTSSKSTVTAPITANIVAVTQNTEPLNLPRTTPQVSQTAPVSKAVPIVSPAAPVSPQTAPSSKINPIVPHVAPVSQTTPQVSHTTPQISPAAPVSLATSAPKTAPVTKTAPSSQIAPIIPHVIPTSQTTPQASQATPQISQAASVASVSKPSPQITQTTSSQATAVALVKPQSKVPNPNKSADFVIPNSFKDLDPSLRAELMSRMSQKSSNTTTAPLKVDDEYVAFTVVQRVNIGTFDISKAPNRVLLPTSAFIIYWKNSDTFGAMKRKLATDLRLSPFDLVLIKADDNSELFDTTKPSTLNLRGISLSEYMKNQPTKPPAKPKQTKATNGNASLPTAVTVAVAPQPIASTSTTPATPAATTTNTFIATAINTVVAGTTAINPTTATTKTNTSVAAITTTATPPLPILNVYKLFLYTKASYSHYKSMEQGKKQRIFESLTFLQTAEAEISKLTQESKEFDDLESNNNLSQAVSTQVTLISLNVKTAASRNQCYSIKVSNTSTISQILLVLKTEHGIHATKVIFDGDILKNNAIVDGLLEDDDMIEVK